MKMRDVISADTKQQLKKVLSPSTKADEPDEKRIGKKSWERDVTPSDVWAAESGESEMMGTAVMYREYGCRCFARGIGAQKGGNRNGFIKGSKRQSNKTESYLDS
ncbi:hypothetical protein EFK13_00980 [Bacillus cabrialesii]|uniref:hypothetical protein n=1 Tax=Bacillus cabrialesii TaxID=2487276 RepID=UPI001396B904|nr:hypothetical protein [Bacillus cabrialesii]UQE79280.1 hypothetical protein EFK13_00980 [Bacillus cabrialesii]